MSRRLPATRRFRTISCAAAIVTMLLAPSASKAALPGALDPSFGDRGVATVALGTWVAAAAVAVQPDGRIVTAGQENVDGHNVIVATRMLANGALDPSFGNGGIATVSINGNAGVDSGSALALQPDGRIVIAGSGNLTKYGPLAFAAVRLLPNGTLDPSFGSGGIATVGIGSAAIANAVAIAPSGKLLLAGTAQFAHRQFAAVQLNPNGTRDTSFGTGGIVSLGPNGGAWGALLDRSGRPVLVGQTDYANPSVHNAQQFMVLRLTTSGAPDPSFGTGGIVYLPVGATALGFGVAQQTNGKLIVTGPAVVRVGVAAAARLNLDGSLDRTFGVSGIAAVADWNGVNGISLDRGGKILLPTTGQGMVRFTADGLPDATFGVGGIASLPLNGGANGAAVQADGNIVMAGATRIDGRMVLSVVRLVGDRSPASSQPNPPATQPSRPPSPPSSTTGRGQSHSGRAGNSAAGARSSAAQATASTASVSPLRRTQLSAGSRTRTRHHGHQQARRTRRAHPVHRRAHRARHHRRRHAAARARRRRGAG